mmetsp:Transcript_12822/g.36021  ORF Transcript_12822/g.36021 Transcript_12822/m.36021 type:complete len:115 (+) Transcript_12822:894-1238(+)
MCLLGRRVDTSKRDSLSGAGGHCGAVVQRRGGKDVCHIHTLAAGSQDTGALPLHAVLWRLYAAFPLLIPSMQSKTVVVVARPIGVPLLVEEVTWLVAGRDPGAAGWPAIAAATL